MLRWLARKLWGASKRLLRSSRRGPKGPPPDVAFDSTDATLTVVDGDTIKVSGVPRPVRLARVDTPERGRPGAAAATRFVKRKLERADSVEIVGSEAGKYGRYVAEIEVDGENLSDLLLNRGLAREVDW